MKYTTLALTAFLVTAGNSLAATSFLNDSNSLVGAKWDVWSEASSTVTTGLDQGAAQSTAGSINISASSVTTDITQDYNSFIGGLKGGGDTYYLHDGGATWKANLSLSAPVSFARVSYSLLGGGMGAPIPYTMSPVITNASILDSGSYSSGGSTVFYTDFALESATSEITATFGDDLSSSEFTDPEASGSFRSVDAIQIEGLNTAPTAIPEPSVGLLAFLAGGFLLRRKRNRS